MDFDLGAVLTVVNFIFANPIVLTGVVALFLGWNLPQPKFAKYVQDKIVAGFKYIFAKFSKE